MCALALPGDALPRLVEWHRTALSFFLALFFSVQAAL